MVSRGIHDRGIDQASLVPFLPQAPPRVDISWHVHASVLWSVPSRRHTCMERRYHPFSKEDPLCTDDRDPVPFNRRRAGILPVCPAPDYLRQEGGCHGTQI